MYKLKIEKSPDTDISTAELEFIYDDVVNTIKELISDESGVIRKNKQIYIQSSINIKELKKVMKPLFSHHFDNIRLKTLEICKE